MRAAQIEWCFKLRQISHFLTFVKIRGGVGKIPIPIVETLPTTEPPKYMVVLCVADEHGGLIKKRKKKKVYG